MDYVTKEDLRISLAPLATREEMNAGFAKVPTREEMNAAFANVPTREEINAAFANVPTREEMNAAFANVPTHQQMNAALAMMRDEMVHMMRDEGDRTRRHFDVVTENLRDDIRLLAEGQVALHQRVDSLHTELKADIAALDRRVMRLEAARG
jgi:cobalamin-dependent methionine synthase I